MSHRQSDSATVTRGERFEETSILSRECKENDVCIGGYARIVTVVKQLQRSRSNPIYFNAGDNFAGTIWFTFGKWNVTSYFLNLLKADVMTIGNHEFDHGPDDLVPFLDTIESPLVLANVDLSEEPQLEGKFLNSTVLIRGGRKIGVIGVIANDTQVNGVKTGKVKFLNEVETVRREADKLDKEGVDIIIVLSHCGIDVDFEIARGAGPNVDVVVGAHTHTFMYTGTPRGPDTPEYDYPEVVKQDNGHKVLIVQASAFAKYVGDLTVYFDQSGEVKRWVGQPIFLGPQIKPDEEILRELRPWREQYQCKSNEPIAESDIVLDNSNCVYSECLMGDVITDAFLHSYRTMTNDTRPVVAVAQSGGIRITLPKGRMRLVANATQPIGDRVVSIEIRCEECSPVEYKPIDLNESYRVVATDFVAGGGDGYSMFSENLQNHALGEIDVDALASYIKSIGRVEAVETGRIIALT